MHEQEIKVGIAQWRVARAPYWLVTLGLGSCVGVALYDPLGRLGGLAHIMLPDSRQFPGQQNPGKFADSALPVLVAEMERYGAGRTRLVAKLAGGAQMFNFSQGTSLLNIGQRNIAAVRQTLEELGIRVAGEDTGGHVGRTMMLNTGNGEVYVRSIGRPVKII
ncbi:MAG: chemotaxis protein CheD [Clostridia bacterium]|nr:chemotaxis protein CheD [Clostridia bacterium]